MQDFVGSFKIFFKEENIFFFFFLIKTRIKTNFHSHRMIFNVLQDQKSMLHDVEKDVILILFKTNSLIKQKIFSTKNNLKDNLKDL